jgi:hypothetical protein
MANNNSFQQDSFEQLAELGVSTVQQTGKAVSQVFNPFHSDKTNSETQKDPAKEAQEKAMKEMEKQEKEGKKSSPLDFQKLNEKYLKQDQETLALERRYFNRVVSETEKAILENKQKEEEKKKQEAMEKQQKDYDEQEMLKQQQMSAEPQGKQKGQMGQARKKATVDLMETKGSGKKLVVMRFKT